MAYRYIGKQKRKKKPLLLPPPVLFCWSLYPQVGSLLRAFHGRRRVIFCVDQTFPNLYQNRKKEESVF